MPGPSLCVVGSANLDLNTYVERFPAPGETLHGDYMEQWVGEAKQMWLDHCINRGLDCSGGDLGNGLQLAGASIPSYGWVNPNPRSATAMPDMLH